ncbi:MAG: RNA 2'-phosphotransferase [Bacteroidales bacterium]|nr:RNA 2'-phosphotransferase [Bacteroidales bacterium]
MPDFTRKEKKLAYLLRHDTNYTFNDNGWRAVCDLVKNHGFTQEELVNIVTKSNKQRFEFSDDKQYIRARQGHSINVDVELDEEMPPDYLYHGTSASIVSKIMSEGICRMSRLHVHLSVDEQTAAQVAGRRNGDTAILKVYARKLWDDGYKIWHSRNNVWLTETVPPQYIEIITTK